MGVYINMDMPKGRPVCIVIDAAGQARRYDLNNDRYADDKLFEAVPVLPQGRLIDADALAISTAVPLDGKPYQYVHIDNIKSAPTIIPAGTLEEE